MQFCGCKWEFSKQKSLVAFSEKSQLLQTHATQPSSPLTLRVVKFPQFLPEFFFFLLPGDFHCMHKWSTGYLSFSSAEELDWFWHHHETKERGKEVTAWVRIQFHIPLTEGSLPSPSQPHNSYCLLFSCCTCWWELCCGPCSSHGHPGHQQGSCTWWQVWQCNPACSSHIVGSCSWGLSPICCPHVGRDVCHPCSHSFLSLRSVSWNRDVGSCGLCMWSVLGQVREYTCKVYSVPVELECIFVSCFIWEKKNLKQSWLPAFWKKIKTHKMPNRMLLNGTRQHANFQGNSSFSSHKHYFIKKQDTSLMHMF